MTSPCTSWFLKRNGHPIRFVLGEAVPCAGLNLATFFPDYATAQMTCDAHRKDGMQVVEAEITVRKPPRKKALDKPCEKK